MCFDNFCTSGKLLLELEKHKTYACGTVRNNRAQFPIEFLGNIEVGESVFIRSSTLITVHWRDKCTVYVMSTIHDNGVIEIQGKRDDIVGKPNRITSYKKYKQKVDKCDQSFNYYSIQLLFYTMVETYLF